MSDFSHPVGKSRSKRPTEHQMMQRLKKPGAIKKMIKEAKPVENRVHTPDHIKRGQARMSAKPKSVESMMGKQLRQAIKNFSKK